MAAGGIGRGGRQMSALEAALARPAPVRTPDGSRQRARSEHERVGGPVATKARTLAPPNVLLTPAREVAARRDLVGHPDETLEDITRLSRYNSVRCGSCHRLSPIGSFRCGFCGFRFLTARDPFVVCPMLSDMVLIVTCYARPLAASSLRAVIPALSRVTSVSASRSCEGTCTSGTTTLSIDCSVPD